MCAADSEKVILVDVDGVLADFVGALWDAGRRVRLSRSGARVELAALLDGPVTFERAEELLTLIHSSVTQPGWCYGIPKIADACELVKSWRDHGARLVFVTTPLRGSSTWCAERTVWLTDVMDAQETDVIFAADKSLIDGLTLIEDRPHVLRQWNASRGRDGVLLACGWNEEDSQDLRRLRWPEIDDEVRELLGTKGA